ncbi:MAG: hypothetical protein OXE74_09145 [Cyanobacteria bacterium MAG CAR2_bin_4]|nr:hypothetical protein [Cyanobacteria bacterium MAG CAR2_bin_4]
MTVSGATTTYRVTTVDDEEDGAVTATIESGAGYTVGSRLGHSGHRRR